MNKMNLKYGLIALAGLGISANASATDLTCSDITFTPEAFALYEFIDKACTEMVERDNGVVYAKLTEREVAKSASGASIRYRHGDGELGPSHKSTAPDNFQTMLSDEAVRIQDLAVRQNINIYVPDQWWSPPVVEVAEVAAAPEAVAAPPPPPPAPEPEPEPEPEMLPTTAGPLPWLVVFGSLFLLLGGALRFSRK